MSLQDTVASNVQSNVESFSRRSFLATTAGTGATMLAGCTGSGGSDSVKIGAVLPTSGAFTSLGEALLEGVNLALEKEFNEEFDGQSVEIIERDSQFDPNTAVNVTRELLQEDDVDFIFGPASSSAALAVKPIIDQAESATWININAATSELISEDCSPYQIRVNNSTYTIGHPMGPWTMENMGETATIAIMDYNYGHDVAEKFRTSFENAGGTVQTKVSTAPGTSNYAPFMRNISDSDADFVFAVYSTSAAANFLQAAQNFGLRDEMNLTGFSLVGRVVQQAAPDAMTGFPAETLYSTQIENSMNDTFKSQYDEQYGGLPPAQSVFGYDGMRLVGKAVTETGSSDPSDVIPFIRGHTFQSPRGEVTIDSATQDAVTPTFLVEADGPNPEDIGITHTFDPVETPDVGCNLEGALE